MRVAVVLVVDAQVIVLERFVRVPMGMLRKRERDDAAEHDEPAEQIEWRRTLPKERDGQQQGAEPGKSSFAKGALAPKSKAAVSPATIPFRRASVTACRGA